MKLTLLFLLLSLLPVSAHASFYFVCTLEGDVESFDIYRDEEDEEKEPEVKIVLTLTDADLEEGHITDKQCNYSKGQKITITTLPTAFEEAQLKNNPERTLKKVFDPGDKNLDKLSDSRTLTVHYRYENTAKGDIHLWYMGEEAKSGLF